MLDIYQLEDGTWIVTYQRNEHSPIRTLGQGDYDHCLNIFDETIEAWG